MTPMRESKHLRETPSTKKEHVHEATTDEISDTERLPQACARSTQKCEAIRESKE